MPRLPRPVAGAQVKVSLISPARRFCEFYADFSPRTLALAADGALAIVQRAGCDRNQIDHA
jgi:hypothetical protein